MNFKLPYYDKKGTIKDIVEVEEDGIEYYLVYRYGGNEKEEVLPQKVSKKPKNYNYLCENYYNDLKEYLTQNSAKYETYKHTKPKRSINENLINILKASAIIMNGASIPFLLNSSYLFFIGITLNTLSLPFLLTSINLSAKETANKKKNNFINQYDKLEHKLRLHKQELKEVKKETRYNGLTSVPSRTRDLTMTKKKVA